jgi:potassium efflux system protein
MPKFTLHLLLVLAIGITFSHGQTASATTNAASTNAPAVTAPTAFAVGNVVAEAQAATTDLQKDQLGLDPDTALQAVSEQLPGLKSQIEDRRDGDKQLVESATSLSSLQTSQADWQSISDDLTTAQKNLSARVKYLDDLTATLNQMDVTWAATLDASTKAKAPSEILQSIRDVRTLIASTTKAVQAHQAPLYSMQNQIAAQDKLTQNGLDSVKKAMQTARAEFFERNHPPLWAGAALAQPAAGLVSQEKASISTQIGDLQSYLGAKFAAVLIHLLLFALLVMGFYWIRNALHARAQEEPALQHAALVFNVPLATALLLALMATGFLYPGAPRLFLAIVGAAALLPAVIITRRLIDPANFQILYATMIAYFVDQIRFVATPEGIATRALFIAELLAVSIFILTALRSKHLAAAAAETVRLRRFTRIYLHFTFFILVFAGFANVFGYTKLAVQVGDGMLESSYLAVILYPTLRILDALTIGALSVRPISRLGMVRRHRDLIYDNVNVITRWAVFALWLIVTLQLFTLRDPLWEHVKALLWIKHNYFSIEFSIGAILAFPVTVWAAFLISRFIRFVLQEEVYPHLQLSRGIPYATSTMVHYSILTLGFFAAMAATGAQLSQFAFLAGAFGVGLGFGLQNIMNNFVSGVILLFERPVKVGDVIQIDATTMGKVERIGIRASVILLTNGSELIVPNGNLISNPVTNWTLSNCERLIEIPVNVTSKVDPQHVLDLLTKVVAAQSTVMKNPAPQTLLVTFGATLSFRVRAWVDADEEWMKITSDLSLAINAALAKDNITIS